MEIVDVFVCMHEAFISSKRLLNLLISRFYLQCPTDSSKKELHYFESCKRSIQLKVLSIIFRWITLNFKNFAEDDQLSELLFSFLENLEPREFGEPLIRLKKMFKTQMSFTVDAENLNFLLDESKLKTQILNSDTHCDNLINNPNIVAQYLTYTSYLIMKNMSFGDYVRKVFEKTIFSRETDNVINSMLDQMMSRSNYIHNWVVLEICSAPDFYQSKLIECFINVAKKCLENSDFNSAMFITLALLYRPVQNLGSFKWDNIGSNAKSKMKILEALLDPSENMKIYRHLLQRSSEPFIPCLPLVMKDLSVIAEINGRKVPKNHIDFELMEKYHSFVKDVQKGVSGSYSFGDVLKIPWCVYINERIHQLGSSS